MKKHTILFLIVTGSMGLAQSGPKSGISPKELVPAGYVIFAQIEGDLNKDGQQDTVYIIKGNDKHKIVKNENSQELVDRNRRGLLIIFKSKENYDLVLENKNCFSSESEDGGVYMPPDLSVETRMGNLKISYAHGRYGDWSYTFRYQNSDFELIGFDSSQNRGPVIEKIISINFLNKKKLTKVNEAETTGSDEEPAPEKFKDSWEKLNISKSIKLKTIADFDDLDSDRLLELAK